MEPLIEVDVVFPSGVATKTYPGTYHADLPSRVAANLNQQRIASMCGQLNWAGLPLRLTAPYHSCYTILDDRGPGALDQTISRRTAAAALRDSDPMAMDDATLVVNDLFTPPVDGFPVNLALKSAGSRQPVTAGSTGTTAVGSSSPSLSPGSPLGEGTGGDTDNGDDGRTGNQPHVAVANLRYSPDSSHPQYWALKYQTLLGVAMQHRQEVLSAFMKEFVEEASYFACYLVRKVALVELSEQHGTPIVTTKYTSSSPAASHRARNFLDNHANVLRRNEEAILSSLGSKAGSSGPPSPTAKGAKKKKDESTTGVPATTTGGSSSPSPRSNVTPSKGAAFEEEDSGGIEGTAQSVAHDYCRTSAPRSLKVTYRGIVYELANDRTRMDVVGSHENCCRLFGHRMKGAKAITRQGVNYLSHLPSCLVDYAGYRVWCQAAAPVAGAFNDIVCGAEMNNYRTIEEDEQRHREGGDEEGSLGGRRLDATGRPIKGDAKGAPKQHKFARDNRQATAAMKALGHRLNLKPHFCGVGPKRQFLYTNGDLCVKRGIDNRFYITSGMERLLPPVTTNNIIYHNGYLYRRFREELVIRSRKSRGVSMPISSDAFSNIGIVRSDEHDREAALLTELLRNKCIVDGTNRILNQILRTKSVEEVFQFFATKGGIAAVLHRYGINVRYLGEMSVRLAQRYYKIRARHPTADGVEYLLPIALLNVVLRTEMVTRTVKVMVRRMMRNRSWEDIGAFLFAALRWVPPVPQQAVTASATAARQESSGSAGEGSEANETPGEGGKKELEDEEEEIESEGTDHASRRSSKASKLEDGEDSEKKEKASDNETATAQPPRPVSTPTKQARGGTPSTAKKPVAGVGVGGGKAKGHGKYDAETTFALEALRARETLRGEQCFDVCVWPVLEHKFAIDEGCTMLKFNLGSLSLLSSLEETYYPDYMLREIIKATGLRFGKAPKPKPQIQFNKTDSSVHSATAINIDEIKPLSTDEMIAEFMARQEEAKQEYEQSVEGEGEGGGASTASQSHPPQQDASPNAKTPRLGQAASPSPSPSAGVSFQPGSGARGSPSPFQRKRSLRRAGSMKGALGGGGSSDRPPEGDAFALANSFMYFPIVAIDPIPVIEVLPVPPATFPNSEDAHFMGVARSYIRDLTIAEKNGYFDEIRRLRNSKYSTRELLATLPNMDRLFELGLLCGEYCQRCGLATDEVVNAFNERFQQQKQQADRKSIAGSPKMAGHEKENKLVTEAMAEVNALPPDVILFPTQRGDVVRLSSSELSLAPFKCKHGNILLFPSKRQQQQQQDEEEDEELLSPEEEEELLVDEEGNPTREEERMIKRQQLIAEKKRAQQKRAIVLGVNNGFLWVTDEGRQAPAPKAPAPGQPPQTVEETAVAYALLGKDWDSVCSFHQVTLVLQGAGGGGGQQPPPAALPAPSVTVEEGSPKTPKRKGAKVDTGPPPAIASRIPQYDPLELLISVRTKQEIQKQHEAMMKKSGGGGGGGAAPSSAPGSSAKPGGGTTPGAPQGTTPGGPGAPPPVLEHLSEGFGYEWFFGPSWILKRYRTHYDAIKGYCPHAENIAAGYRVLLPTCGATFRIIGECEDELWACQERIDALPRPLTKEECDTLRVVLKMKPLAYPESKLEYCKKTYNRAVPYLAKYGVFFGQKLAFTAGRLSGMIAVVLGMIEDQLYVVNMKSRETFGISCRNRAQLFEDFAPVLIGVVLDIDVLEAKPESYLEVRAAGGNSVMLDPRNSSLLAGFDCVRGCIVKIMRGPFVGKSAIVVGTTATTSTGAKKLWVSLLLCEDNYLRPHILGPNISSAVATQVLEKGHGSTGTGGRGAVSFADAEGGSHSKHTRSAISAAVAQDNFGVVPLDLHDYSIVAASLGAYHDKLQRQGIAFFRCSVPTNIPGLIPGTLPASLAPAGHPGTGSSAGGGHYISQRRRRKFMLSFLSAFGVPLKFDRSDESCGAFGLFHGQRISLARDLYDTWKRCTIVGVLDGELWIVEDGYAAATPLIGRDSTELAQNYAVCDIVGHHTLKPFEDTLQILSTLVDPPKPINDITSQFRVVLLDTAVQPGGGQLLGVDGRRSSFPPGLPKALSALKGGDVIEVTYERRCKSTLLPDPSAETMLLRGGAKDDGKGTARTVTERFDWLSDSEFYSVAGSFGGRVFGWKHPPKEDRTSSVAGEAAGSDALPSQIASNVLSGGKGRDSRAEAEMEELFHNKQGELKLFVALSQDQLSRAKVVGVDPIVESTTAEDVIRYRLELIVQRSTTTQHKAARSRRGGPQGPKEQRELIQRRIPTFPPPNLPQCSNAEVEKHIPFVFEKEKEMIRVAMNPWPVTQTRLILQWMLSWFGCNLAFAETKVTAIERLAAIQQYIMQRPIPMPQYEDYLLYVALKKEERQRELQDKLHIPAERLADMRRSAEMLVAESFKRDGFRLLQQPITALNLDQVEEKESSKAPPSPSAKKQTSTLTLTPTAKGSSADGASSSESDHESAMDRIAKKNRRFMIELRVKDKQGDETPDSDDELGRSGGTSPQGSSLVTPRLRSPSIKALDPSHGPQATVGTIARKKLKGALRMKEENVVKDVLSSAVSRLDSFLEAAANIQYNTCGNPMQLLAAFRRTMIKRRQGQLTLLRQSADANASALLLSNGSMTNHSFASPLSPGKSTTATASGALSNSTPSLAHGGQEASHAPDPKTYKTSAGQVLVFSRTAEEEEALFGACRGQVYRYTSTDLEGMHVVILGVDGDGKLWRYEERIRRSIVIDELAHPFAATTKTELLAIHPLELVESDYRPRVSDPFWFPKYEGPIRRFNITEHACIKFKVAHGQRYLCSNPPHHVQTIPGETHGPILTAIGTDEDGYMHFASDASGAWAHKGNQPVKELELAPLYQTAVVSYRSSDATDASRGRVHSVSDDSAEQTQKYWFRCPTEIINNTRTALSMTVFDTNPALLARFLDYVKATAAKRELEKAEEDRRREREQQIAGDAAGSRRKTAVFLPGTALGSGAVDAPPNPGGETPPPRSVVSSAAVTPQGRPLSPPNLSLTVTTIPAGILDGPPPNKATVGSGDSPGLLTPAQGNLPSSSSGSAQLPLEHGSVVVYRSAPVTDLSRTFGRRAQQEVQQGTLHRVIVVGVRNGFLYYVGPQDDYARPFTTSELESLIIRRPPPERIKPGMEDDALSAFSLVGAEPSTNTGSPDKAKATGRKRQGGVQGAGSPTTADQQMATAKRLAFLSSPDVMDHLVQSVGRTMQVIQTRTLASTLGGHSHTPQAAASHYVKGLNGFSQLCLFDTNPYATIPFGFYTGDVVDYRAGQGMIQRCVIYGVRNDTLWKVDVEDDEVHLSSEGEEEDEDNGSPTTKTLAEQAALSSLLLKKRSFASRRRTVTSSGGGGGARRSTMMSMSSFRNRRASSVSGAQDDDTIPFPVTDDQSSAAGSEQPPTVSMFNHCSNSVDIQQRYGAVLVERMGARVRSFLG